jgi:ElaB/YqjD/DUF883 family membrane-anchored ribosome-binding protein
MENIKKLDGTEIIDVDKPLKRDYLQAAEKMTEAAKDSKSILKSNFQSVQTFCRENPGKAVAIATAVGAATGLILSQAFGRRKSTAERVLANIFRTGEETWDHVKSGIKSSVKEAKKSD